MPIVRLPKGELRDEVRQPVWDSEDILGTVSPVGEHNFFSSITGKTLTQTNMTQPGAFETAKSFRLQGLAFDAQNFRAANFLCLPLILERSSLSLKIGEKIYWQGPARFGAGRLYQNAATTASEYVLQQHGVGAIQPVILAGRHSVDINPLQQFGVKWIVDQMTVAEAAAATPAVDTLLRFVMSLKGLLRRPVQ
jgi:hypothetical protein